jgi:pimeloyl-[acyl-carrier protein] methyl ester esterase
MGVRGMLRTFITVPGTRGLPNGRNRPRTRRRRRWTLAAAPLSRPRVVVLPGMDGGPLLLEAFAAALGSAQDPTRVLKVRYPRESHLHPITEVGYHIIREYLTALNGDDRGYIIVAQSYSGHVALSLCSGRLGPLPGKCTGCVLVNTFCSAPTPDYVKHLSWLIPRSVFSQQLPLPLISFFLLGAGRTEEAREVQASVSGCEPGIMLARMHDCLRDDSWPEWTDGSSLNGSSVLYLRGLSDPLVGKTDLVRRMSQTRSDIRFVGIHDGPHLLLQCAPEACARAIDSFFKPVVEFKSNCSD